MIPQCTWSNLFSHFFCKQNIQCEYVSYYYHLFLNIFKNFNIRCFVVWACSNVFRDRVTVFSTEGFSFSFLNFHYPIQNKYYFEFNNSYMWQHGDAYRATKRKLNHVKQVWSCTEVTLIKSLKCSWYLTSQYLIFGYFLNIFFW